MIADGLQLIWTSRVSLLAFGTLLHHIIASELGRKRTELRPVHRWPAFLPALTRPRLRAKPPTTPPIQTRRLLLVGFYTTITLFPLTQTRQHKKKQ